MIILRNKEFSKMQDEDYIKELADRKDLLPIRHSKITQTA